MTPLIVRPAPACYELVDALAQSGITAIAAPLLSFSDGSSLDQLSATIDGLPAGSIVVVVSPRAAEFSCRQMAQENQRWRQDLSYIAIGEKTAQTWQQFTRFPLPYPTDEKSEGLLEMPVFSAMQNKKVVILRGNNGRALFGNTLEKRGAQIQYLNVYQRHWHGENLPLLMQHWQSQNVDTLIVTSNEQLSLLCQDTPKTEQAWLTQCNLLVPSKRIYNQAVKFGFERIINVESASNAMMLDAFHQINNSGKSDD